SAKDITARLYPSCTESDRGTVHSMLQRLEKKCCVTRDRSSRPHLFSTTVSQSDVAGSQLQDLASRITGGSLSAFLTHLVQADSLSDVELKEIRRLIDRRIRKAKKGEAS
ncbi:MAG: BlaI/MecI/CopY family transcriptional regulator, partial [Planctomycetes bacterium]|nr:BlaI/MecI/CopY family transcriptional regulator [Planctomycetota bacterium]